MQYSAHSNNSSISKVEVNLDNALVVVSDQFLSVTLDAGGIHNHWRMINLTSPRILNLAKRLSPASLRVGGTSQDFVIFSPNGVVKSWKTFTQLASSPIKKCSKNNMKPCLIKVHCHSCKGNGIRNYTMTGADWDLVNNFVLNVGWELIFGLNVFLVKDWRLKTWDSSNARELIQYTLNKGYKVAWELGNGMRVGFIVCIAIVVLHYNYVKL